MNVKVSSTKKNRYVLTSSAFSVAATAKRFEKVGPGHNIVTVIPVAIFSVRKDSKYPYFI